MRGIITSLFISGMVLALAQTSLAQNVSIQLTPQGIPIQIPASGGSFNYTIAATNNGTAPQQAAVWCLVTLPNGNPYGPVLGPATITLNAGQTLERLRTQNVPGGAPDGDYTFSAYIGIYPDTVWDSHAFPFEKLTQSGGMQLWAARYNGSLSDADEATSVAADSAGNVYVTGYSPGSTTDYDYATVKYDISGNQVWVARYNGPGNGPDFARALVLDADGNIYVTGGSTGDFATIKYNSAGVVQWVARYSSGPFISSDQASALAVDASGNVYATGTSDGQGTLEDYCTIKYNSVGTQLWVARYNSPGDLADFAHSLAVDADGNVCVTGLKRGAELSSWDYCTVKYNSAGSQQWVASYNGPGNSVDEAQKVVVDGSGNFYVTGLSTGSGTYSDYCTIRYSPAGGQQWVARYNGPLNGNDGAHSMVVDAGGNAYVTGFSWGDGTAADYCTVNYNSWGAQQWVARYNGPGNSTDVAYSIAADQAGNVIITGKSLGSGSDYDYCTVKYGSDGTQQWIARYNGPGNGADEAISLALDLAGNVYTTGSSAGTGTDLDYATIKYSGGNMDNWLQVEATILGQPLPQECRLEPNYPNPFNASTVLSYQLPVASNVTLRVYDTAGRLVETLVDGWRSAGVHELTFDASHLPSGMYVYRIQARKGASVPGEWSESGKMMLLK